MGCAASTSINRSNRIQWMWTSCADPFSKPQPVDWCSYSDIENRIIEEAFQAKIPCATLGNYHIDFKRNLQISNNDGKKQRSVKRMVCDRDDRHLREEKLTNNPVAPDRPYGDLYGFISPFIKEVVKDLNLTQENLPSKDEKVVLMVVNKAADGIIEEGKKIGQQEKAEWMAEKLKEKKEAGMQEVWICCAYLYSLEEFLYKKLNETMRSIGSDEHEQLWRSKVRTLGPFCLLLWDNPFDTKMSKPGTILYRGVQLPDNLIATFKDDNSKDPKPIHSFQAFTSCTRNRRVAEQFVNANVVFIMTTRIAFTVDLSLYSEYSSEEEELLLPGVCFMIDRVEFDIDKNKHLIYLTLQQRHNRSEQHQIKNQTPQPTQSTENAPEGFNIMTAIFAGLAALDPGTLTVANADDFDFDTFFADNPDAFAAFTAAVNSSLAVGGDAVNNFADAFHAVGAGLADYDNGDLDLIDRYGVDSDWNN